MAAMDHCTLSFMVYSRQGSHEISRLAAVHTADLGTIQTGVDLRVIRNEVQHADTALALCVVEVAAQLRRACWSVRASSLPSSIRVRDDGIVTPVHLNITGTGLEAAAHTQAGQRGSLPAGSG